MSAEHEYSIIGHSRAIAGRYLGTIAGAVASFSVLLVGSTRSLLEYFGFVFKPENLFFFRLLAAGVLFALVHWLFNKYVWRWKHVVNWLKIPDLNGEWHCTGQTLNAEKEVQYNWSGKVTIRQSWEKIWVRLETGESASVSASAAIIREPDGRYRLMYRYKSEPRMGAHEIAAHVGFAEVTFSSDLSSGDGDYFNNKGRYTFGTLQLRREAHG